MDGLFLKASAGFVTSPITVSGKSFAPPWGTFSFKYPLRSLWGHPGGGTGFALGAIATDDTVLVEDEEKLGDQVSGNWVFKILRIRSFPKDECASGGVEGLEVEEKKDDCCCKEECSVCDDDEKEIEMDKKSFLEMLKRVTLAEARVYAQMSYLGSLAYSIPQIKPGNLLKSLGLRFVTSSLDKKKQALNAEKERVLDQGKENASAQIQEEGDSSDVREEKVSLEGTLEVFGEKSNANQTSGSTAHRIAASAASYLHSRTSNLITFKSLKAEGNEDSAKRGSIGNVDMLNNIEMMNGDMASFIATTDSVTSVVAAKEEVKQAVADDLNSTSCSPCGWFICDDDRSATRFFVIQGSESVASWQANLLFEPIQFEGLDVLVHRGIYEAAKGIYEQMLPEVRDHVKNYGSHAIFRFTGHSLGGSLSLMVNLMMLIRGEVSRSSLLPVITFGAPSVMCGGDRLLHKLGLPKSHIQSIAMHRDIVPRAFSCNYPNHVAELLKAVNGNFRNHPCLKSQGLLYAPMGEFVILQPDEKFSPHHDLLPSGSGLYILSCPISDVMEAEKHIRAAQSLFMNSPHPLEMLRDRSSYGSKGTILRDHDMRSYLKSVRDVIRQELKKVRKAQRVHRHKVWWPFVATRGSNTSITMGKPVASTYMEQSQLKFAGVLQNGRESMKRFSRLVASQHMHLLVVFLLPARTIISILSGDAQQLTM
ncbi:phospholipase A1 PLIP2, chloroplastic [Heracleum sosnowskyi]|uniref:Phospholipase A1 PLIP2, chloroplastic n=1 Tax=Heracleum sosnowskyi TaxID=360622 RepID=A0AAD8IH33_9APIA|nr:phospholipase A1 PLIP2, chloroplastic [Heracleum sosnowskyi]